MRYVQRNAEGKVIGHYANEQSYAKELVPDDHPDIVARTNYETGWREARRAATAVKFSALEELAAEHIESKKGKGRFAQLEARVAALEALIKAKT